jgi:hypothetical protein
MASSRGRLLPFANGAFALAFGLFSLAAAPSARAGKNDLDLLKLCPQTGMTPSGSAECAWVQRNPANGQVTGVALDNTTLSNFRSLMSELGVVVAPRLQTPADTLGFSGFQFSAEFGMTKISNSKPFWNAVNPSNPNPTPPGAYLTTVGGFVRKGIWLPLPGFEIGAGAMNVVGSNLFSVQGYAKFALQEGFHDWVLPSVAVRGSVSQLLGTDQVDLTVSGIDILISKAFSVGGTARFEPFGGWNYLFIDARSGVIDATPGCDAYQLAHSATSPGPACSQAAPSLDDYHANFSFPRQDLITRQRFFAGFKLKLAVLFMVAEYDLIPAGHSRDDMQVDGANDESGQQQSFSLSAGFDF